MSERTKKPTKDLIVTAIGGAKYGWLKIRPFVFSLGRVGFKGDKVVLAAGCDPFTLECVENRGFEVLRFTPEDNDYRGFVIKHRFVPLLRYLSRHRHEYRYVIWVDAGDQIFQRNPSDWLDENVTPGLPILIAARECRKLKDETQFNVPWLKQTVSATDYEWLAEQEIVCGGTIAGDAETVYRALCQVYQVICDNPHANDQAAWNYVFHKPFNFPVPTRLWMPSMRDGWTATLAAFKVDGFDSIAGCETSVLTDEPPVFDVAHGMVLTPDGKTPFCLVHQYNRDNHWVNSIPQKYRWE